MDSRYVPHRNVLSTAFLLQQTVVRDLPRRCVLPGCGCRSFNPVAMSTRMTAEERNIVTRARFGGRGSGRKPVRAAALDAPPVSQGPYYPAGASTKTLGLLGKFDALLKAEPLPPRWALMRVLSLLEEERDREAGF